MDDMVARPSTGADGAAYPRIGLLIDGAWIYDREPSAEVLNPSDDSVLGTIPRATPADLERVLAAAQKGFETWRATPLSKRCAILTRAATLLRARKDEIARVLTLEQGKPVADSRNEVERAATYIDWDVPQSQRLYSRVLPQDGDMRQTVLREPAGVVAAFTPWNVPISSPGRKVSGALAAGCSIILKPAQETPATACLYAQCFLDAGVPPGVLNIVFGKSSEISSTLIASPIVRMVTLTGSVPVGKQLSVLAAQSMIPVLMELGGHAPVIVGGSVDPVNVAGLALTGKFRMAGQLCVSPTRFLVDRKVYAPFVDEFARLAGNIKVGDGFAADTEMGPVINGKQMALLSHLVEEAVTRGARVAAGGKRIGNRGNFFAPTVLADVPLDAEAMHEEPFGPLALCTPVDGLDEALRIANSLPVGLAGYGFTNDAEEAERIMRDLESGVVSINHFSTPAADAPFGGVKDSGIGKEGGEESLDLYTRSRTIMQRFARV